MQTLGRPPRWARHDVLMEHGMTDISGDMPPTPQATKVLLVEDSFANRDMLTRRPDDTTDDAGTKPGRDYRFGARSGK